MPVTRRRRWCRRRCVLARHRRRSCRDGTAAGRVAKRGPRPPGLRRAGPGRACRWTAHPARAHHALREQREQRGGFVPVLEVREADERLESFDSAGRPEMAEAVGGADVGQQTDSAGTSGPRVLPGHGQPGDGPTVRLVNAPLPVRREQLGLLENELDGLVLLVRRVVGLRQQPPDLGPHGRAHRLLDAPVNRHALL